MGTYKVYTGRFNGIMTLMCNEAVFARDNLHVQPTSIHTHAQSDVDPLVYIKQRIAIE